MRRSNYKDNGEKGRRVGDAERKKKKLTRLTDEKC
jgi:hypothetical protein